MNAVIYARFSSHNQTQQSIEGQVKTCKEYAERNNMNIIHIYKDEARSGTSDKREQFQQMVEDSKKKTFQVVLVYQFDRFARNRYDSAKYKTMLKKNGVKVISAKENITDDPMGVVVESFLEGMAEYYSLDLGQKASRGMGTNAEHCYFNGSVVPLGLKTKSIPVPIGANGKIKYKKVYDIDEEKAPIVKEIYKRYLNGETMVDIMNYLNKKGIKTARGGTFNKNSIKLILTNEKYIGTYQFKNIEKPNVIPRIIDDDTFYKVQERINKNKHAPARTKAQIQYLLTTKLFCGTCKEMMVGTNGTSGNGTTYHYYACKGALKHKCKRKNVKKDYIENLVVDLARNSLTDKNIEQIATAVYDTAYKKQDSTKLKGLQREILKLEKQKQNLLDSLSECSIAELRKSIFEKMEMLEQTKLEIENEIRIEKENVFDITKQEIRYFLHHLKKVSENDIKYRQILIDVLIYEVYLYDNNLTIIFNVINKNGEMLKTSIPTVSDIEKSFNLGNCSYLVQSAQPNIKSSK